MRVSKAHWNLPIGRPHGCVHSRIALPTLPVRDGPENRNGIAGDAAFVLADVLNTDPSDRDHFAGAIETQCPFRPRTNDHATLRLEQHPLNHGRQ